MTAEHLRVWRLPIGIFALALVLIAAPTPRLHAAATIVILNNDGAGEGFNDPTAVAPIGGNPGTTLGQQRLNVFQAAFSVWAAQLTSNVTITVVSNFDPLTCTATSAILGSAGTRFIARNFANASFTNTWYTEALADKFAGTDLVANEPEIQARFNSNLGQAGCLTGIPFYLGLDNNHGANTVDLMTIVLHEIAHGLGFATFTSGTTGAFLSGNPSIFDRFLVDTTSGLTWANMLTDADRVASAINTRKLVWNGPNVTTAAGSFLQPGTPELRITGPATVTGTYLVGLAAFGAPLTAAGVSAELMPVSTSISGAACNPLSAADSIAVNNKIALIDRGVCGFTEKVKNAQNAGARAVIIVNNAAGSPPPGLGGADPTITIPTVSITQADGALLKSALRFRSRTSSGLFAQVLVNLSVRLGADPLNRVLMYTPNPFIGGSSVAHWDTSATPNLLMEPNFSGDLTHAVGLPLDLTRELLRDLGWQ